MAKLPDDTALGGMPTANWSRPIAVVDTSPLEKGATALAKGIGDLGTGLIDMGKKNTSENSTLEEAKATAAYTTGRAKLDDELSDLNDPEEIAAHKTKYDQNLQTAAGLIQDPKKRELFQLKYQTDAIKGGISADTRADKIQGDQEMADFHTALNSAVDVAPKLDPDTRTTVVKDLQGRIDKLQEDGRITADRAVALKREVGQNYATASVSALPAAQRVAVLSAPEMSGDDVQRTQQLLRGREGFQGTAYWDVNHNRVGYGSDTITLPDGTVKEVRQGDAVTKEDAERDLARRTKSFLGGVRDDIGAEAYDKLPPNARAALGSVAYNYGSLPERVVEAAKTGDAKAVGDAIERLQGDNDGVNRSRRILEASIARGGAMPAADMVKFLPEDKRVDLLNQAIRDLTQEQRATADAQNHERATVKSLMDDDKESIENTGKPLQDLTPERVARALGPQTQADFLRNRELAQKFHDATNDWDRISTSEIQGRVDSLKPKGGDAGFAAAQQTYDKARTAADKIEKLRTEDPATSVETLPEVRQARQVVNAADPSTILVLAKARVIAQERIGIPEGARMPVTKVEAKAIAKPIIDAADGTQTMDAIRTVLPFLDKAYGDKADQVLEYALTQAGVEAQVAKTAHGLMRRLQAGQPLTQTDSRQLQTDQTNAAMSAAAGADPRTPLVFPFGSQAKPAPASPPASAPQASATGQAKPSDVPPTTARIQDLIANPSHAQEFDRDFGEGSAARVMQRFKKGAQ